jgi:putative phosphoribosyl transferase
MQVMFPFRNRTEAGQMLATTLREFANRDDVVALALPRGGVPVGFEVAKALHASLDVFVVRKLGLPGQEELAMGAIASGGARVLNGELIRALRIPEEVLDQVTREEQRELERREREYRDGRPPIEVGGKTVILVDDGLATGSSMRAAVLALKQKEPAQVVVAVPVAPADSCHELQSVADRVVCAVTPQPFLGVGQWYEDFSQTSDEEVRELLRQAGDLPSHRAA